MRALAKQIYTKIFLRARCALRSLLLLNVCSLGSFLLAVSGFWAPLRVEKMCNLRLFSNIAQTLEQANASTKILLPDIAAPPRADVAESWTSVFLRFEHRFFFGLNISFLSVRYLNIGLGIGFSSVFFLH